MRPLPLAFAGAGLAALSLATRLSRGPLRDRPLVLVDPVSPADDPRTFSCWAEGPSPLDDVAFRAWTRLGVGTAAGIRPLKLAPMRYLSFSVAAWRAARVAALPQATLLRATVDTIEDSPYGAALVVDGERLPARWVFDSRFSPATLADAPPHTLLWQSFRGAWVEADDDAFDPDLPLWMDFRAPQPADGVAFGYVLPATARSALVEVVGIGPRQAAVDLEGYLSGPLGVRSWRVLRREGGASPMTDRPFPRRAGDRTLRIGVAGGRVKPSTGYGIPRILADAEAVAASLERRGHPFDLPRDRALLGWFDAVMLRVMHDEPRRMVEIFDALLRNNPAPRVLRLLDERPGPGDLLGIAASLPPGPFLRAMLRGPEYYSASGG